MKYLLVILISFLCASLYTQEIKYFPQEQIIVSECGSSGNVSDCFYNYLERKVSQFLSENKKSLKKLEIDTLNLGGSLVIGPDGIIDKTKSRFGTRIKNINSKIDEKFEEIFLNTPIQKVINSKSNHFISRHFLEFEYIINKKTEFRFELVSQKTPYNGGIVQEAPRFPGCENLNEIEARKCFQNSIQEHIRKHFIYPKEAQKNGISGIVNVMFVMEKNGEIIDIRTRGPHQSLEEEATRIIKLLPNIEPGKQNGIPVKVPYSIPMTFRLH